MKGTDGEGRDGTGRDRDGEGREGQDKDRTGQSGTGRNRERAMGGNERECNMSIKGRAGGDVKISSLE